MRLGQSVLRIALNVLFCTLHGNSNVLPIWRWIAASRMILRSMVLKTCPARLETCGLCTSHGISAVLPVWLWFATSRTTFTSGALRDENGPKRALHCWESAFSFSMVWVRWFGFRWFLMVLGAEMCDLANTCFARPKRAFCAIFMEMALFCQFGNGLSPVGQFSNVRR